VTLLFLADVCEVTFTHRACLPSMRTPQARCQTAARCGMAMFTAFTAVGVRGARPKSFHDG
jgi:hypothetical protein